MTRRCALRLLVVGATPPPYFGMSTATECLLAALREADVSYAHVDIADRRDFGNMNRLEVGNVVLAARSASCFLYKLAEYRPTVVYMPVAQTTLGFLRDSLFLVPSRLLRKRVVVHLHGCQLDTFHAGAPVLLKQLMKFSLGRVTTAIVLGAGGESQFRDLVPADRVRVVPNGLPDLVLPPGRCSNRPVTALYLSTMMREKGILDLLRAMKLARKSVGDLRVVFAGGWYSAEDEAAFRTELATLGLNSGVELLGPVEGAARERAFSEADYFVLPPRHVEGQPFAILEAMRAALPVVTTASGFIPQMVVSGECGLVVPRGDVAALAEALVQLAQSSDLRVRMGHAARARYLAEYTLEKWSERMMAVFAEAAGLSPST